MWGFTNLNFKLNLKVSAFYLEKQKSFIPKKKFFWPLSISKQKSFVYWLNFLEGFAQYYWDISALPSGKLFFWFVVIFFLFIFFLFFHLFFLDVLFNIFIWVDEWCLYNVIHSCSFIIATSLFLHLKLQFSGGQEWGREGCHSHSLFNIWFLWYEDLLS